MHFQRIALTFFALFTATASRSFPPNLVEQLRTSQVLAQTTDTRKTAAQRLLNQGTKQFQSHQFEATKQSWQQALFIYRELKDRSGEGKVLNNLGLLYKELKE